MHRTGALRTARCAAAALSFACTAASLRAQGAAADSNVAIPLWSGGAPGALGSAPADIPTVTPYLPPTNRATGTGAIIFPGGGYEHLATDKEGTQVARWLNTLGVAAFVVRYRLGPRYHDPVMREDALRAVRLVRARASTFGVDTGRVGVVGFSAGGHMASTAATHFDGGNASSADPVERVSSRPDFAVLAYPVITMAEPYAHRGSRTELLGDAPSSASIQSASNELHVTHGTPPTFLVATSDDATVPVENTLMFYRALHAAGVPAELHVFQHGRHGFGLAASDSVLSQWPSLCAAWLRANGWLTPHAP